MDWAQILVIILSVFLALFLLLAIVLMTMLIKISRQIKTVTNSAERTVEAIEKTVGNITRFTSPLFLLKRMSKIVKKKKGK